MQRTDPDVVSVVYSGDNDVRKEKIIDKVKVSIALGRKKRIFFIRAVRLPGSIRHSLGPNPAPFCLFGYAILCRGFNLASLYPSWPEYWIYVPRLGGYVQAYP